jgi:putative ABC transport system substrate-binding protein
MRRRDVLAVLGAAPFAFSPFAARAQQSRMRTIGILMAGAESASENQPRVAALQKGLAELGWRDGENIRLVYRWSEGKRDLVEQYAKELVALAPDMILANSTPVVTAFKKLNPHVPVVFALDIDPVGLGHVESISRPGGNTTGFTFIDPDLIGKWVSLLRDLVPGIAEARLLFNPRTMFPYTRFLQHVRTARTAGDVELKAMAVGTTEEMQAAIDTLAKTPKAGLLFGPDPFNQVRIKDIAQITTRNRLPTISVYRSFVSEGGLMSYGPDTADVFRQAAGYIDRILKGANPGELPVQAPVKYELAINLKTAKALGIAVSPVLLARADEVIE